VVALAEALYPAQPKPDGAAAAGGLALFKLGSQYSAAEKQQQQQQDVHMTPASSSVTDAFCKQLSYVAGGSYSVGSWLPSMTADVPELLRQHQQALQQQQQQQQQEQGSSDQHQQSAQSPNSSSSSSMAASGTSPGTLSINQAAMMKYMLGDIGGFMRAAVLADVITPDVVALAAAGGSAAWAAAARLAAAKLEVAGQVDAAAVYLLAAEEPAAAAAVMR
jgi:Sec-independent protein translocase protein TatA